MNEPLEENAVAEEGPESMLLDWWENAPGIVKAILIAAVVVIVMIVSVAVSVHGKTRPKRNQAHSAQRARASRKHVNRRSGRHRSSNVRQTIWQPALPAPQASSPVEQTSTDEAPRQTCHYTKRYFPERRDVIALVLQDCGDDAIKAIQANLEQALYAARGVKSINFDGSLHAITLSVATQDDSDNDYKSYVADRFVPVLQRVLDREKVFLQFQEQPLARSSTF